MPFFSSLRSDVPDVLFPTDPGYEESKRTTLAHYERKATVYQKTSTSIGDGCFIDEKITQELRNLFPSPKQLVLPGMDAYEELVYVGNLLYSMKRPGAFVLPSTYAQVVAVVNFARRCNIHLTVKNGGHSFAGYSLNSGGLVMDMGHLKNVRINEKGTEVTIQAGCVWNDVYDALKGKNIANIIVGGQCPTVGVSGFTLGGGLSPFTRSYGLGIDSITEMTVVTAGGLLLVIHKNDSVPAQRELFWAMAGGGGGNFAILVEFKTRVHALRDPFAKVVCGQLSWDLSDWKKRSEFEAAMEAFNARTWPNELTIDSIWRYIDGKLFGQMTTIFNGNKAHCYEVIKPLLAFKPVDSLSEMTWHDWVVIEQGFDDKSPSYYHYVSFVFGQGAINSYVTKTITSLMEESRRLLDECHGQEHPERKGNSHFLWDMAGGKAGEVAPKDTAYYWRDGVFVANFKIQWLHPKMKKQMLAFADKVKKSLMPHTLEGRAAYINYIDPTVKDWQYAYYGPNYDRLQSVKARWDPHDFFSFRQSVKRDHKLSIATAANKEIMPAIGIIGGTAPRKSQGIGDDEEPVGEDGEPLTAIERTEAAWNKYELPEPEKLWALEKDEPTTAKMFMVIEAECIEAQM